MTADKLSASDFWAGEHGAEYLRRNDRPELLEYNRRFFSVSLLSGHHMRPKRVIEFGANIGMNLRALRLLDGFKLADFTGVDINLLAVDQLEGHGFVAHHADITKPPRPWGSGYDFVLVKGVLIHIPPGSALDNVYTAMYEASREFIFIAEYFSATRRKLEYQGFQDKLWLADYGSEFWDRYPDLELLDYGFAWKRDMSLGQDDLSWWFFRKPQK